MRFLLSHSEMKSCDSSTTERYGIPPEVLMERAALAVRDTVLQEFAPEKVLVLCGSGNNGGDGFAAARLLLLSGVQADVLFLGTHAHMTDQCLLEEKIFQNYGGRLLEDDADIHGYDLIIDALFGIGLSRDVLGRYADMINAVNRADTPVLSVDIPSGISADDGQIMGTAVRADVTVTFQYEKLGQMLFPGAEYCGKLVVADVGISDCLSVRDSDEPVCTLERSDLASLLPRRHADDNKGDCGKLLIAAGNSGMAGAAILAARAAFRSGVGMVCILTHEDNRLAVQTAVPEAIFAPWPGSTETGNSEAGKSGCAGVPGYSAVDRWLSWCDAAAVGPGFGRTDQSRKLLTYILRNYAGPLVVDADALNIMSENPQLAPINSVPAIITPHPGEMKRLLNAHRAKEEPEISTEEIVSHPVGIARDFAKTSGMITVLKGARTVVTDGDEVMLNTLGNEGMATAGSGDSLTGIIGSPLAQRLDPFEAARTGVLLHALAGDRAAAKLGTRSMKAGDLADCLPDVLKDHRY